MLPRRSSVDLYVTTSDVSVLYEKLKDRVDVHKGIHDTFYGMREFIVRDVNGFWVTFGQSLQNRRAGQRSHLGLSFVRERCTMPACSTTTGASIRTVGSTVAARGAAPNGCWSAPWRSSPR
jgi:hypothetical protein